MQRATGKAGQRLEPGEAGLQVADYIDEDEAGEVDNEDDHDHDHDEQEDEEELDDVEGRALLSCW